MIEQINEIEEIQKLSEIFFEKGTYSILRAVEEQIEDEQKKEKLFKKYCSTLVAKEKNVYLLVGKKISKSWDPNEVCVEEVVLYIYIHVLPFFQNGVIKDLNPHLTSIKNVKRNLRELEEQLEKYF